MVGPSSMKYKTGNTGWFGKKIPCEKDVSVSSGVTTMGSDRENPGAPNEEWAKWAPPSLGDRAKTLARASDMSQCRFLTFRIL